MQKYRNEWSKKWDVELLGIGSWTDAMHPNMQIFFPQHNLHTLHYWMVFTNSCLCFFMLSMKPFSIIVPNIKLVFPLCLKDRSMWAIKGLIKHFMLTCVFVAGSSHRAGDMAGPEGARPSPHRVLPAGARPCRGGERPPRPAHGAQSRAQQWGTAVSTVLYHLIGSFI